MHLKILGLAVLCVLEVGAFEDTSPFFLFSTTELPKPSKPVPQIISSSSLTTALKNQLSSCPSDAYIIVSQLGVNAVDFAPRNCAPHLRRSLDLEDQGSGQAKSSFRVTDVVGELNLDELQRFLETKCEARVLNVDAATGLFDMVEDMKPRVIRVDFPALPTKRNERKSRLADNDAFLFSIIDLFPSSKYTVVYTTTPVLPEDLHTLSAIDLGEHQEMLSSPGHMQKLELRSTDKSSSIGNETVTDGRLFDEYQFFTPAIFMGLLVLFLLGSILSVAIRGIASVQVPYGAFDKEMGPAAQKKQQ